MINLRKIAETFFVIALAFLFVFPTSCSLKRSAGKVIGSIAWDGQEVLEREADVDMARQMTPALIASLAVFGTSNPFDRTVAALLAKTYGQYAYGFFEEDLLRLAHHDPKSSSESFERADRFYQRGKEAGIRALERNSHFRKALRGSQDDFERALRSKGKGDVPLLFWTAFSWAGFLNLHRNDPEAIIDLPRVAAMIDRVVMLDPGYAYGSALSFRAVIDASRPKLLGGNLPRAKEGFEAALAHEPRYLMTKVLYAQYYAVQVQDRALFERLLKEVLAADGYLFPEQQLANALAKRRAALLIERMPEWF